MHSAHYVRALIYAPFKDLYVGLSKAFGNCFRRCFRLEDGRLMGIIIGERFFFRTSSTASLVIVLEEKLAGRVLLEAIAQAGGKGFMDISYGAHVDYAHDVLRYVSDMQMGYELLNEISYFTPSKAPYDPDEPLKLEEGT
ncbi:MAG TPA: hypothetical protein ENF34_00180 [Candidatus Bathyarchaeota archaeon]|nr:MAG: hypothetical protein DRO60_06185 [Candidatus Bathyarchaeota archaeon]HDJ25722.1 hypothetical protein [Candidatus Bathyarchaeota archaeon]